MKDFRLYKVLLLINTLFAKNGWLKFVLRKQCGDILKQTLKLFAFSTFKVLAFEQIWLKSKTASWSWSLD